MDKALRNEEVGSITIVTFIRPDERNPLSISVLEELTRIVEMVRNSRRQLILTGTGEIFASGANLREIAAVSADQAREFALRGQHLMNSVTAADSVAAVNGLCFGGAFDLAMSCRSRFASPAAEFSHPGGNLGIMTGWGGTQRLPRLVGEARALEIFLTGRRVPAEEAMRIGLVDAIADDPLEFALKRLRA